MSTHHHVSVDQILLYGVSAIIVINLARILAAKLGTLGGPVGYIGNSVGALVHFGS